MPAEEDVQMKRLSRTLPLLFSGLMLALLVASPALRRTRPCRGGERQRRRVPFG